MVFSLNSLTTSIKGIYAQKPKEDGYYMMRIKIPGGQLTAKQTHKLQDNISLIVSLTALEENLINVSVTLLLGKLFKCIG